MTLFARLDKEGKHVVCGVGDCSARIATIQFIGYPDHRPPKRRVKLRPGWTQRDDVWELSKHAKHRVADGKKPANSRVPKSVRKKDWGPDKIKDLIMGEELYGVHEARCPRCDSRQTLDPVRLNCTEPHPSPDARSSGSYEIRRLPCGYPNHQHTMQCIRDGPNPPC